mgnify:CR=1 FL=1
MVWFIIGVVLCLEFVISFIYSKISYGNLAAWITYLFSHIICIPLPSMLLGFFVRIAAIVFAVIGLMKGIPAVF